MNTHSIAEHVRSILTERMPNVTIYTPINNVELSEPYLLLSCTADEELISGNGTWECTLEAKFTHSGYVESLNEMRRAFAELCSWIANKEALNRINELAPDFILYHISLRGIEEPEANGNSFNQSASFRVVVQF